MGGCVGGWGAAELTADARAPLSLCVVAAGGWLPVGVAAGLCGCWWVAAAGGWLLGAIARHWRCLAAAVASFNASTHLQWSPFSLLLVWSSFFLRPHPYATRCPPVRAGLAAASAFETLESPAEVATWLRAIHLPQYVPTFVAHGVSFGTLLTLNSVELRDALGVKPLAHRRLLLDGIAYLEETLHEDTVAALPEDGRILTHLSNERTYLGWCRGVILLLAVATSTLQLEVVPGDAAATAGAAVNNKAWVTAVCTAFTLVAVGTLLYALWRFNWNWRVIEAAGRNFEADNVPRAAPVLLAGIGGLIAAYAVMAGEAVAALRPEDAVVDVADTARLASALLLMAV